MTDPHQLWPDAEDLQRDEISFSFRDNNFVGHLVAPTRIAGAKNRWSS